MPVLRRKLFLLIASVLLLCGPTSDLAAQETSSLKVFLPFIRGPGVKFEPNIALPVEQLGEKLPVHGATAFFKGQLFNSTRDLSLWLPPNAHPARGILFMNGSPTRPSASDPDWRNEVAQNRELAARQLASLWGFALIA